MDTLLVLKFEEGGDEGDDDDDDEEEADRDELAVPVELDLEATILLEPKSLLGRLVELRLLVDLYIESQASLLVVLNLVSPNLVNAFVDDAT